MAVPSQDAFKLKDLQTLHVRQRAPRAAAVSHPLAPCGPSLTRPRCVQDAYVKQQEAAEASLLTVRVRVCASPLGSNEAHKGVLGARGGVGMKTHVLHARAVP